MKIKFVLYLFFLLIFQVLSSTEAKALPLKIGFILVGPASDLGWNYFHDQGRKFLESAMPGKVTTTVVESVPENAEAERVMEKLIAQGDKLIFSTSYGYLEPAMRVAARHPDVIIMQSQRSVPTSVKNMGTYFGRQFEPMYATGVVAGRLTKTNKLGYIGGHPVPPIIGGLNAFMLGARSVNPKVKLQAVWTDSWNDAAIETEATKSLIESGADVIVSHLDNGVTVLKTCASAGVFSAACNADLNNLSYKTWLTGQKWNWGPLYVKIAQSVIDHTWKSANSVYSMKDGYVGLASFGPAVPLSIRKEAESVNEKIKNGSLIIFKGPLKDNQGHIRVAAGQILSDDYMEKIDWFIYGVQAPLGAK